MANLLPLHIDNPGARGDNRQDAEGILDGTFSTRSSNMIINTKGKLTVRPGTQFLGDNTVGATKMHGHRDLAQSDVRYYAWTTGADDYSQLVSGSWVVRTGTGLTPTGFNPKWISFKDKVLVFGVGSTGAAYHNIQQTAASNFTVIVPTTGAVPPASAVLSAWGRIWCVHKNQLQWCDLLDETAWGAGATNQIDLRNVWAEGNDYAVGIAEFNGFLVIFGRKSIIIYQNPDDIANMTKVEAIGGVGCLHRDSIQNIGEDIIFLTDEGLVTLGRVIQEKSMPAQQACPQVREDMLNIVPTGAWDDRSLTSAFSPRLGLYLLRSVRTDGNEDSIWAVDTTAKIEGGSFRATKWDFDDEGTNLRSLSAVANDPDGRMLVVASDPVTPFFFGPAFLDDALSLDFVASDDSGGSPISWVEYRSGWLDFREVEIGDFQKIMKKSRLVLQNAKGIDVTFRYWYDYDEDTVIEETKTVPSVKEVNEIFWNMKSKGHVLKIGVYAVALDDEFTITRATLYAKRGKLSL